MTRSCALLVAIAALLVACGKYGPPRRVRPEPTVSPAAELEAGVESPVSPAAEPAAGEESPERDDGQENNP
jgi:hypothetical protein